MSTFLNKILDYFNVTEDEYEKLYENEPTIVDIPDASFFNNCEKVSICVRKHISNKSKIIIYGDYDCDGMIGTSIVKIAFNWIKQPNVSYFIPSRYKDGYGLNMENAKKIVANGYNLVICVDNGISQYEPIKYCVDNGLDVIICDHHLIPEVLPPTPYIIHPFFSKRPEIICSGGFCAYILACMIEKRKDLYALSLAGITTISDMMKLVDYNKSLVSVALKIIDEKRFRQIVMLNNNSVFIDEGSIGGYISPRINSVGRLQEGANTNRVIEFFTTEDNAKMDLLYEFIDANNTERKLLCKNANTKLSKNLLSKPSIIFETDEKEGIIGLIAGQFCSMNNKLAIVMTKTKENENILKGSVRSKNGLSVNEMLKGCSKYLLAFGGHDGAGGFSIERDKLYPFVDYCQNYAKSHPFTEKEKTIININANDVTVTNYYILNRFGPFGEGNPRPTFKICDFPTKSLVLPRNKTTIIVQLSLKEKIVIFNANNIQIPEKTMVSLFGHFGQIEYNNTRFINFYVDKIE